MTSAQVLGAAAAWGIAAGVALVVAGLRGWAPRARAESRPGLGSGRPDPYGPSRPWAGRRGAIHGLLAVGVGALAGVLTGWPALAVAAAGAVLGLPAIVGAGSRASDQIERVEAVEEWARRVADVLAIGVGLEQAVQTAARTAPPAIAAEASTLAARIAARTPTETALRRFADEVADPTADLVVAALVLASRRRGPGVAVALTALAESVGEEVAARRRIEADRAKPRATARAVTVITLVIVAIGLLNRGYTDPYGTVLGQVVLSATLGFFAASLWWMHSMTRSAPADRLLGTSGEGQP